jgi:hypothetical protein
LLTAQWKEECFQNATWNTEFSVLTIFKLLKLKGIFMYFSNVIFRVFFNILVSNMELWSSKIPSSFCPMYAFYTHYKL